MPARTWRTAVVAGLLVFGTAAAREQAGPDREAYGLASFYGAAFEGRRTASGTIFDKEELVAAHPSYPFGTRVRVTNLDNGRSVTLEIVDRGPTDEYVDDGVIIDVSHGAARVLGFLEEGRQRVRVHVLSWGDGERSG